MQQHLLLFAIFFTFLKASPAPAGLEQRDNVAICEAALIALKASSFCSSFIGLHDATTTSSIAAQPTHTTTTVISSCTTTVPGGIATSTVDVIPLTTVTIFVTGAPVKFVRFAPRAMEATTIPVETTTAPTPSAPPVRGVAQNFISRLFKRVPNTTTTPTSTTTVCKIAGLPASVQTFACSVISQACSLYVHPHTTTSIKTFTPTSTATTTVSGKCQTVTGAPSTSTITETSTMTLLTTLVTYSISNSIY